MSHETLFSLASGLALLGWLGLIFLPAPWRFRWVVAVVTPLLAGLYAMLVVPALAGMDFMDFSTLEGVMRLQGSESAALVGWVHYLCFDLLVGWIIATDAAREGISRWWVVPCLLLCFMLGPVGWLSYLLLKLIMRREWAV